MISYGKVVLFFSVTFKSDETGYSQLHNLCLVEELQEFTWSARSGAGANIISFANIILYNII